MNEQIKFRLTYPNGTVVITTAKNALEVVKRFDLATREGSKIKFEEI